MEKDIKFKLDGKEYKTKKGTYLVDAARENGVYIPTLCNFQGVKPQGSCRICTVKVNGRYMAACTTPVTHNMEVESSTEELQNIRKSIVELLFAEGNHFCPSCERSGNCELQALAYRYQMMVPQFPYQFPNRLLDASDEKILIDHNRCILCKRCVRSIQDDQGRHVFTFSKRGNRVQIIIDKELADNFTDNMAQEAMDTCPVGALIRKEKGFDVPIGKRKYDFNPIGSEIERKG